MHERPILTPELLAALNATVSRRANDTWLAVWAHADRETGESWPGTKKIARLVQTNRHHIWEDVQALKAAGWLRVGKRGRGNQYTVLTPPLQNVTDTGHTPQINVTDTGTIGSCDGNQQVPNKGHKPIKNPSRTQRKDQRKVKFDPKTLPRPFSSDAFQSAYFDFCDHRQQSKHPLTELAATKILAKCERVGEAAAIAALDEAVENCWRGIFPKASRDGNNQPSAPKGKPVIFHADGTYHYGKS